MKYYWLLMFAIGMSNSGYNQLVTTIVDVPDMDFRDDIITDTEGNLYCSDYGGENVYKRTPEGEVSIFATGFNTPNGLAFDSFNDLFICDNIGDRIYKLDIMGNFLDTFEVAKPSGIIKAWDSDTMIFTQYSEEHVLRKLAPDGTVIEFHSGDPLNGPVGLAYDNVGQLYVANFNNREIYKVFDDELEYLATVPGPATGSLGFITYGNGFLWGTSWGANKIYRIGLDGEDDIELYAGSSSGSTDGPIETALFASPNGIHASVTGDTLYISEYNSGRLRMISPDFASNPEEFGIAAIELNIYPNPSTGEVYIASSESIDHAVIQNIQGQLITKVSNKEINSMVMIEESGVYIVSLFFSDGQIKNQKIIVE